MKSVLVTGANGFVGRHCLPLLTKQGYQVHAISRAKTPHHVSHVDWHKMDLLGVECFDDFLSEIKPTHLLHLGWDVEHGKFWNSPENDRWVEASKKIIKSFRLAGGQRMVGAGTCAEYQWSDAPLKEATSPLNPVSPYGVAKKKVFDFCENLSNQDKFSFCWGRIFHIYGPHEDVRRLVPSAIHSLLKGEPAMCTEGLQKRDFLFIEDVAAAFVLLLGHSVVGAVNIGSGMELTVRELLHQIGMKMGKLDLIKFGGRPMSPDDPEVIIPDVKRLQKEIGWQPKFSLDSGLENTIAWWKQQSN